MITVEIGLSMPNVLTKPGHQARYDTRTFEQVPIGQVEGYWDRKPSCNIRHSNEKLADSREYFDEVDSGNISSKFPYSWIPPNFRPGGTNAYWRSAMASDAMNFARPGVDLSSESLEMARKRAAVYDLTDRIHFFHCSTTPRAIRPFGTV